VSVNRRTKKKIYISPPRPCCFPPPFPSPQRIGCSNDIGWGKKGYELAKSLKEDVNKSVGPFCSVPNLAPFCVCTGSPADKADLEIGDEILEVNGKSLDGATHTEVISHIHQVLSPLSFAAILIYFLPF